MAILIQVWINLLASAADVQTKKHEYEVAYAQRRSDYSSYKKARDEFYLSREVLRNAVSQYESVLMVLNS